MTDSAARAERESSSAQQLEALQKILIPDDYHRLFEIYEQLEDPNEKAKWLVDALPRAVAAASTRDDRLGNALAPTIGSALRRSMEEDPQPLVDAIFPIIGPAIRRSVTELVGSMVDRISQSIDHSLSPKSVAWRFESWRSGVPFAEIVLRETLLYRVEQVFLIHRETGLLLAHRAADESEVRDPDLVSAMLTAVRQFMSDSFGGDGNDVQVMDIGEMRLHVESGPEAVVAALVRGAPPSDFREILHDTAEQIHFRFGAEMRSFEGDPEALAEASVLLERALVESVRRDDDAQSESDDASSARRWGPRLFALTLVLLVVGLSANTIHLDRLAAQSVASLDAMPGISVLSHDRDGENLHMKVLRDPHAEAIPESLAIPFGDRLRITARQTPFLSLEPEVVLRRARDELEIPPTVRIALRDRVLVLTGAADPAWIRSLDTRAPIPGIARLEVDALDLGLDAIVTRLESTELPFEPAAASLGQDTQARLASVAHAYLALRSASEPTRDAPTLVLHGMTDATGSSALNAKLARRRAEAVRSGLLEHGVPGRAMRVGEAIESDQRGVSLRIEMNPPADHGDSTE